MDQPTQTTMSGDKKVCNCTHHKVVPWAIILIGITVFLTPLIISYFGEQILVGIFLVVIGVVKLNGHKCGCCSK